MHVQAARFTVRAPDPASRTAAAFLNDDNDKKQTVVQVMRNLPTTKDVPLTLEARHTHVEKVVGGRVVESIVNPWSPSIEPVYAYELGVEQ